MAGINIYFELQAISNTLHPSPSQYTLPYCLLFPNVDSIFNHTSSKGFFWDLSFYPFIFFGPVEVLVVGEHPVFIIYVEVIHLKICYSIKIQRTKIKSNSYIKEQHLQTKFIYKSNSFINAETFKFSSFNNLVFI